MYLYLVEASRTRPVCYYSNLEVWLKVTVRFDLSVTCKYRECRKLLVTAVFYSQLWLSSFEFIVK